MIDLLHKNIKLINEACANNKVANLFAFGSVLTDNFNEDSDIDLIVSFFTHDPVEYAESYFDLKFRLEDIFGRQIDLLEQKAINNKIFEKLINQNKVLIYGKEYQGLA